MGLKGMKVMLTGTLAGMDRMAFKKRVTEAGGEYVLALKEGIDLLVVGDKPIQATVDKARALSIPTVDKDGFEALIKSDGTATPARGSDREVPIATTQRETVAAAIEIEETSVRVLDVRVERLTTPGPMTPSLESFRHYTLDARTLEMLRFIARAVRLGQPCLLEGETATSKTSAIVYMAALTQQQVVRINLNGQTDTSELVGRFIPNERGVQLQVEALFAHLDLLEEESQMILRRANLAGRSLTEVEAQQVAANEKIHPPAWRFQEGIIPQAMRHGWWVILDEMNLAEPQVLERLNSVLEREPSLVLTEGPGTRIGPNGDVPVHPNFRIFATMNPAEYQGRSVLSPAYKDRWIATWQAEAPGEMEYQQMLERAVFGRQPDVSIGGLRYQGSALADGPSSGLTSVPGIQGFLVRLAALHAGLVQMSSATDGKVAALGASRRERYVFSRRSLLAVLDGLERARMVDPVAGTELGMQESPEAIAIDTLEQVYVNRVRGADDRKQVVTLLRSLGLSRDKWMHRFEATRAAEASTAEPTAAEASTAEPSAEPPAS